MGYGGYHTASPDAKQPRPYGWATYWDILTLVKNPADVPKDKAPWVIPSSTGGEQARSHQFQHKNGIFHMLWADLDDVGILTALELSRMISDIFPPGTAHLIYSTKSATPENNKSRILIPLDPPAPGSDYVILQRIFNDKLEAAGIQPDRATERAGQLCYLPNKGDHYDFHIG